MVVVVGNWWKIGMAGMAADHDKQVDMVAAVGVQGSMDFADNVGPAKWHITWTY